MHRLTYEHGNTCLLTHIKSIQKADFHLQWAFSTNFILFSIYSQHKTRLWQRDVLEMEASAVSQAS